MQLTETTENLRRSFQKLFGWAGEGLDCEFEHKCPPILSTKGAVFAILYRNIFHYQYHLELKTKRF